MQNGLKFCQILLKCVEKCWVVPQCAKKVLKSAKKCLKVPKNSPKYLISEKLGQYRKVNDSKNNNPDVECMAACKTQTYSAVVTTSR